MIQITQLVHGNGQCQVRLDCTCGAPGIALYPCEDEQIVFCTHCGTITTQARLFSESSTPHISGAIQWLDVSNRAECPLINTSLAVTLRPQPTPGADQPAEIKGMITKISADKCFLRLDAREGAAALQRQQEVELCAAQPPLEDWLPGIVEDVVWPHGPQNPTYYKIRLVPRMTEQKTSLADYFQSTCGLQFDSRVLLCLPEGLFGDLRRMIRECLPKARVVQASGERHFLRLRNDFNPDFCLLPLAPTLLEAMGHHQGQGGHPPIPYTILLLPQRRQEAIQEALRWGVDDFLFPDSDKDALNNAIQRCRAATADPLPLPPAAVFPPTKRPEASDTLARLARPRASISDEDVVRALCMASETHDPHSSNHLNRIAAYTAAVTRRLGFPPDRTALLATASKLHDVGKMGVPDEILRKTGALTVDERQVMQEHTRFGFRILQTSGSELMRLGATIALRHHERHDGAGYPEGLSGEAIPIEARIITVVDVFDALTTQRAYKPAWSNEKAIEFLQEQAGRMFDPAVIEAFLHVLPEIEATQLRFMDDFRDVWTERRESPRIPTPPVPLTVEIALPEVTFRPRGLAGELQNISHGGLKVLLHDVTQDLFTIMVSMRRFAKIACADGSWDALDQITCAVSWVDYYAVPDPNECLVGLNFQKDPPQLAHLIEALPYS